MTQRGPHAGHVGRTCGHAGHLVDQTICTDMMVSMCYSVSCNHNLGQRTVHNITRCWDLLSTNYSMRDAIIAVSAGPGRRPHGRNGRVGSLLTT